MSGPAADDSSVGELLDRADDWLEDFAETTERNLDTATTWLERKQAAVAHADSTLLGVVVNTAMTALGVGVALGGFGQIATAVGVAWAVLNGYPLALAGWRWLVS